MGACAACVGPQRRAEKYQVNRLTSDSPLKNSVTASELPLRKHKDRLIQDLNQSKKRMEHSNLINPLLTSLGIQPENSNSSLRNQKKLTSSVIIPQVSPETPSKERHLNSNNLSKNILTSNYPLKRVESRYEPRYSDENHHLGSAMHVFDRPIVESHMMQQSRSPFVTEFKTAELPRDYRKEPLSQSYNSNKSGLYKTMQKSNRLLNIPEVPEEDAKTPHYVSELRKENGEDVLPSGLASVPQKLQTAPGASLFKYLKDLQ